MFDFGMLRLVFAAVIMYCLFSLSAICWGEVMGLPSFISILGPPDLIHSNWDLAAFHWSLELQAWFILWVRLSILYFLILVFTCLLRCLWSLMLSGWGSDIYWSHASFLDWIRDLVWSEMNSLSPFFVCIFLRGALTSR